MDNDIEVANKNNQSLQRHKDVLLFLNKELDKLQQENGVQIYNLETEYAKTKKNKSPFAAIILSISLVVVALAAFTLTKVINRQNEKIAVNVAEFDDLNLKSLLNSASKVQSNYDEAIKTKTRLENEMESEIKNAAIKRDNDLFLIDSLNLDDPKEIANRKSKITATYNKTAEEIKQKYELEIAKIDQQIEKLNNQLKQYNTDELEAAREQESAMDSERQVQELEKNRISQQYEKRITELEIVLSEERRLSAENIRRSLKEVSDKYTAEIALLDPSLSDPKSNQIISSYIPTQTEQFQAQQFLDENSISDPTIENGLELYQKFYDDYKYLRQPIVEIPHKNSVPDYISTTNKLVDEMGTTFENTAAELYQEKQDLYKEISNLHEDIKDLENNIEGLKQDMKNMEVEFQKSTSKMIEKFGDPFEGLFASLKTNAAVISADSKDNITIFVSEKARYLINENTSIEIKGEKSVKGRLTPTENKGYYKYLPALDADGNLLEFDFSLISCGNIVKILAK